MTAAAMEAEAAAARRTRAMSEVRSAATNDYNVRAWADRKELLGRAMTASGYTAADASAAESKALAASREQASKMRAETACMCSSKKSSTSSSSCASKKAEAAAAASSTAVSTTTTTTVSKKACCMADKQCCLTRINMLLAFLIQFPTFSVQVGYSTRSAIS